MGMNPMETIGEGLGNTIQHLTSGLTETTPMDSWASPYNEELMEMLTGYMKDLKGDPDNPTVSPYAANTENALTSMLTGNAMSGPDQLSSNDLESYYKSNILSPATRDFNQNVLPGIRSGVSNLHSGHRENLESRAGNDLMVDLNKQRGNLLMNNLTKNQDMDMKTNMANLGAQVQGVGMMPQMDPVMREEQWMQDLMAGMVGPPEEIPTGGQNWMSQIFGGGAAGGSFMSGLMG